MLLALLLPDSAVSPLRKAVVAGRQGGSRNGVEGASRREGAAGLIGLETRPQGRRWQLE